MKALAILPVAAAAILGFNISAASSQQACQAEFKACMDYCGGRSSKQIQDTCFQSCEGKNNMCAERVYGKRPFNGAPTTAAAQKSQATNALAKDKGQGAAPQEQVAEEPAPAQAAPAPQQTKAAPQQRGPARR